MKKYKQKIKYWTKTVIEFILNPRLLLCLGISWIITNGWAYITAAIAVWLKIDWLAAVSGAYLAALWIPFTPEKIITVIKHKCDKNNLYSTINLQVKREAA